MLHRVEPHAHHPNPHTHTHMLESRSLTLTLGEFECVHLFTLSKQPRAQHYSFTVSQVALHCTSVLILVCRTHIAHTFHAPFATYISIRISQCNTECVDFAHYFWDFSERARERWFCSWCWRCCLNCQRYLWFAIFEQITITPIHTGAVRAIPFFQDSIFIGACHWISAPCFRRLFAVTSF